MASIALSRLFIVALAAATGGSLASFAVCFAERRGRRERWGAGRSACRTCRSIIAWHDNVPVISWIVLGGHCRICSAPIDERYAALEAAGAIGAAVVALLATG